jgi:hypothetical protein
LNLTYGHFCQILYAKERRGEIAKYQRVEFLPATDYKRVQLASSRPQQNDKAQTPEQNSNFNAELSAGSHFLVAREV